MLMLKMSPAATPSVVGLSGGGWPVAPPSITCKREAPWNDWNTSVVSAAGTPMLKRLSLVWVLGRPSQVDYLGHPGGADLVRLGGGWWQCDVLQEAPVGPGHVPRGEVLRAQSSQGTLITLARRWILVSRPCSPRTASDLVVGHTLSRYRGSWR
ncbi:hypothetical protein TIFTF001_014172 [Ficus carica]|uniref:Uncharacterized protein n=1 Tax=Ficus carica TaxID=3494 RepID=A0AA88AFJ4_FICCA|nr:hypothetical protein TIFTF001_014172 [Ficus carica]